MGQIPLTVRRWKRTEYDRLVELGAFAGEPIELIAGQLVVAEPQGAYHVSVIGKVDDALRAILPPGWLVRTQAPLSLDDDSEPEPDLAVVSGRREDYLEVHPTRPVLLIEVADSSLDFDREQKGSLYARAGIADYWIVNLVDHVLEVHRHPVPEPAAAHGWRYASATRLGPTTVATLLAFPERPLAVSDLLPSRRRST